MKLRLGIVDMDDVFFNKAKILLSDTARVERIDPSADFSVDSYDAVFTSADSQHAHRVGVITFGDGGDVPLPCRYGDIEAALSSRREGAKDRPLLYLEDRCARLGTKEIPLTKKEAQLLRLLLEAKGTGITSGEIQEKLPLVFGDYNSLKVYVNYLRKKLEADGDKIIFSTRIPGGCKYTVHDKYWRIH